ncbi:MAG: hypothetical protein B7Z72_06300, partial [Gemmatimonadetes bacterium 21-71-4]
HYGLAFLLLKRDDRAGAMEHLDAFLGIAPSGGGTERWVQHARQTLSELRSGADATPPELEP